jgi:hypothetical protein
MLVDIIFYVWLGLFGLGFVVDIPFVRLVGSMRMIMNCKKDKMSKQPRTVCRLFCGGMTNIVSCSNVMICKVHMKFTLEDLYLTFLIIF